MLFDCRFMVHTVLQEVLEVCNGTKAQFGFWSLCADQSEDIVGQHVRVRI